MTDRFYLPLLKSKAGEFTALSKLFPKHKEKIIPLFDITKLEFDHSDNEKPKTLADHVNSFCKKVLKSWFANPFFVDTSLINDERIEGKHPLECIYEILAEKDVTPMPVIYPSSTEEYRTVIVGLMRSYFIENVGIRVTIEDVTRPSFEVTLEELLSDIGIEADECHLVLDLKDADFSKYEDFSDAIADVIVDFPLIDDWKSFTVAGGAFPSISTIKEVDSPKLVPRNDWRFYNTLLPKLEAAGTTRNVNFGDYSIVSPSYFEFNPKIMSTSANIRYTLKNNWYVVKGTKLKKSIDFQQYFGQAQKIATSRYYAGERFSDGDAHIKKCAAKKTTTGNANTWIAVGTNHHFTRVITDLFSTSSLT